jgi:hypothetical protein
MVFFLELTGSCAAASAAEFNSSRDKKNLNLSDASTFYLTFSLKAEQWQWQMARASEICAQYFILKLNYPKSNLKPKWKEFKISSWPVSKDSFPMCFINSA